ncbi:MAG: hypothetical protein ACTH1Z_11365 [Ancrocorticia sp.]|uniref:hypothetical protein n=1 Tax=Ancrocorticia sp. TaxID=2593684 RepID=UPI003F9081A3
MDREKYFFDPDEEYAVSILTRAEFELGIQSARDARVTSASSPSFTIHTQVRAMIR